jgi:hypothetical protein
VLLSGAVAVEDIVEEEPSIIDGTMRSISGPGRWTRTDLSLPISEVTLRLMQAPRGSADSTGGAGNPEAVSVGSGG